MTPDDTHPLVDKIVKSCTDKLVWPLGPDTDWHAVCAVLWGHRIATEDGGGAHALQTAQDGIVAAARQLVDRLRIRMSPKAAAVLLAQISCQLVREQDLDLEAHRYLLRYLARDLGAGDLVPSEVADLLRQYAPVSPDWESE